MFKNLKIVALISCIVFSQTACYNSYFVSTDELQKLGSSMKQEEIVTVYADCSESGSSENKKEASLEGGKMVLLADAAAATTAKKGGTNAEVATDASPSDTAVPSELDVPKGCTAVKVSTQNPITILAKNGENFKVTPFNFTISGKQIIAPEYNVLEKVSNIKGGEVKELSTWKTVSLVVGSAVAAVGAFVAVAFTAKDINTVGN